MSDNEFDAELLALAGDDDSASDAESVKADPVANESPSPEHPSSSPATAKSRAPGLQKGVALRKVVKSTRAPSMKKKVRDESEEEGQASSPDSLGSGAMSESESDTSPDAVGDVDNGVHYPVDGKYVSEKEKAEFMAMPELLRESKLADRAQEIERKKQDQTLRQLRESRQQLATQTAEVLKKRKAAVAELDESPRKVSKAKVKANDNLENYKRQREQRADQRRRNEDNRRNDKLSPSQENADSDADGEGDSDVEWAAPAPKKAPQVKAEPVAELRHYERVRLGRSRFAQICFTPGFEDAIKGCFARVNLGIDKATGQNVYRMTQIKGFTTGKMYNMEGVNGRPFHTDQWANLVHGKAERLYPLNACSDSKFTEIEWERYKRYTIQDGLRLPTYSFLDAKCDVINRVINHEWTGAQIEEKLRRSGVLDNNGFSSFDKRAKLNEDRQRAIEKGDEALVAKLDQELTALDGPKLLNANSTAAKPQAPKPPTQQERLLALNRSNRRANQEAIRKAQLAEKKREHELQQAVMRGEATANPFARVKTRAKVNYDVNEGKKAIDDLFGEASDATTPAPKILKKSTPIAQKKYAGVNLSKQKKMDEEVMAHMDLGIDLDVNDII